MMRTLVLLLLGFGSALPGRAGEGCAGYRLDVSHELALDAAPATDLAAGRTVAEAPRAPFDRRLLVTLLPESAVTLAAAESKRFPGGPFFAGLALLEPPADGTWAVGAAPRLWFDVVDLETGTVVEASGFDMRADCPTLVKIVEFPLKAGRRYVLQLTSAPAEKADISVTRR